MVIKERPPERAAFCLRSGRDVKFLFESCGKDGRKIDTGFFGFITEPRGNGAVFADSA